MNSHLGLNKVHHIYRKTRYYFLALFVFAMTLLTFVSDQAYGDSVVGTVVTKINLTVDGKTRAISTTQNTLQGALEQNDITLNKNDITIPDLNTYLSGREIEAEVVRAIPVLISDNGQSWVGMSAFTQPENILKQLNVEIYPEDRVSIDLILDVATEGLAGQKITIERAPVYTIYVDGETKTVRSWVTTVGDLFIEEGVSLGLHDIVEPSTATDLSGVSEITITRINYVDIVQSESVTYKTTYQYDYNLYRGQSRVVKSGVAGTKDVSYHIVYRNGVEISRTITGSVLISAPVTEVIANGVKPTNDSYGWWPTIVDAANKYGVDPVKMYDVMMCESHGNQFAGTTYKGLFQYLQSTWDGASVKAGYGGRLITDGEAQIYVTAWKVANYGWGAWPYCSSL